MLIRWKTVIPVALLALGLTALVNRIKAAPQAAPASAPTKVAAPSASPAMSSAGSIPDTTLAINSTTPLSQRVVHYEIDAKYDAVKHIVDGTEVLTYHNLTGQALDHFPFHL
jgi:hypothetical protein